MSIQPKCSVALKGHILHRKKAGFLWIRFAYEKSMVKDCTQDTLNQLLANNKTLNIDGEIEEILKGNASVDVTLGGIKMTF